MALHDTIQARRDAALARGEQPVADVLQGVTKARISEVLERIDRSSKDCVDATFALLDDGPSWFTQARWARFCDGATTAHVACHVGILQRGKGKLDREGRDNWLKPLWEIGVVEKVYLFSEVCEFIPGHPIAKSGNTAYRLAPTFVDILKAPEWQDLLNDWINEDSVRQRLELQAKLAAESRTLVDTKHSDLIQQSKEYYAKNFLPGYSVVYVDDGDGDRITEDQRRVLADAGIEITLSDAMPDVLLWNQKTDCLWVIEAVTSDGEVDSHKKRQLESLAKRSGKNTVGFTTAYPTWKVAATRQGKHKNICPETYIWIAEDPSKQLRVTVTDS